MFYHDADDGEIRFRVKTAGTNTDVMTLVDGSVGIGTDSPNQLLEVKGTSGTAAARIHADTITSPRAELEFMRGTTDTFGGDTYTDWKIGTVGATQADFAIISSDTTRGSNERLTIEYDTGNVGIGTSSPSTPLHIAASVPTITLGDTDVSTLATISGNGGYLNLDAHTGQTVRFSVGASEKARIDSSGNVGIGTSSPLATGGTAKLSVIGILSVGLSNSDMSYIRRQSAGNYAWQTFDNANTGSIQLQPYGGNVGIGTSSPHAKLQVEEYGIDTTETSTTATTQVAIHTMSATAFRSARFTVQVTNSTDSTYHLTEILMIHDGTTPSITEYGTIFTGSAEATFDADISSGNVRLLATPASTDTMEFKVVAHSITT
jgi:hypothetical protein